MTPQFPAPLQEKPAGAKPLLHPALLGLIALLASAVATAEERVEARYEVLWGGLEIGRFDARLRAGKVDYRFDYRAETTGFLGWLFPFVSEGASEGALDGAAPAPVRFVGASRRRDGWSRWSVEFDDEGEASRVAVDSSIDEQRDPVPPVLRRAPDPLALALQASGSIGPGADLRAISFDGKRAVRFELACDARERPMAPAADGWALERVLGCTLDGGVEAGRSRRWQNGRDDEREPARILVTRELVADRYWPVRVEAATRFGTVIVRLIALR